MHPSHLHPAGCGVSPPTMAEVFQSGGGEDPDSSSGQDDLCTPTPEGFGLLEVRGEDSGTLCV